MIKVRLLFGRVEATIDNYKWTSDNEVFARLLNLMLSPYGPSGADPYPDMTAAKKAIERFGGEIVYADQRERNTHPEAIY